MRMQDQFPDAVNIIKNDPKKLVIRGNLSEGISTQNTRRTNNNFASAPLKWCLIDFDTIDLPSKYQEFNSYHQEIIAHTISHLPREFQGVDCWENAHVGNSTTKETVTAFVMRIISILMITRGGG